MTRLTVWAGKSLFLPANSISVGGKYMEIGELMAISIGVSMDAFAIAIRKGLSVEHVEPNTNQGQKWWEELYCSSWGP